MPRSSHAKGTHPMLTLAFVSLLSTVPGGDRFELSAALPTAPRNRHVISSRDPLAPSPLAKLPIGAIEPRGWVRRQLELMADGFTGRLPELSEFCKESSGWLTLAGPGWEEVPYWLKGFGDLGYVLKDER